MSKVPMWQWKDNPISTLQVELYALTAAEAEPLLKSQEQSRDSILLRFIQQCMAMSRTAKIQF